MLQPRVGHPAILSPAVWRRIGGGVRPYLRAFCLVRDNWIAVLLILVAFRELRAAFDTDLWFERRLPEPVLLEVHGYASALVNGQIYAALWVVFAGALMVPADRKARRSSMAAVMLTWLVLFVWLVASLLLEYLWAVGAPGARYDRRFMDFTFRVVSPVVYAATFANLGLFVPFVVAGRPLSDIAGQAWRALVNWPWTFCRLIVYAVPLYVVCGYALDRLWRSSHSVPGLPVHGLSSVGWQLLNVYCIALACVLVCDAYLKGWRAKS